MANPKRVKKKKPAPKAVPAKRAAVDEFPIVAWVASHGKLLLQVLIIVAAGGWAFSPALHGEWLWDDDFYITANPLLHDPARLLKTWFVPGSVVNYFPITATVQWIQWELWHNDTFGYHVTNVVLHLLGALLVWRLLSKFGLRLAWLGGLIFALHPTSVESVAWASELKNTLSLPPFLLAMCAWIDYEERRERKDYFLALGLFLVAMLCKTTMVAFPVVILLYAWWKRGRIGWSDLKTSAPFFVLSLVLGAINVVALDWLQQSQKVLPDLIPMGGFFSRLACSGLALVFYFGKAFLPVELLPIYPQWTVNPPALWQFLPWLVMGGAAYWLWTKRQGWGRHALLGLGFFVLNLAPFTGFILNSFMRFAWVMDHFIYIGLIGLIGLVVAGLGQINERLSSSFRPYGMAVVALVVALMAGETHWYSGMYVSRETLWTYAVQRNPGAYMAHNNLGDAFSRQGRVMEALQQFKAALALRPDDPDAEYNLGSTLCQLGQISEGIRHYRQALRINPNFTLAHNNLGNALVQMGRYPEAEEEYVQALRTDSHCADAHNNLGNIMTRQGLFADALEQYNQVLLVTPDFAEGHNSKGVVLAKMGRFFEAQKEFQEALKLDPEHANARSNLAKVLKLQRTYSVPK